MRCICTHTRDTEQIGHWERCPLEGNGYTTFLIHRCSSCGGIFGFPNSNLDIALERGTEKTKMQLHAIIADKNHGDDRARLIDALKEALESFAFLDSRIQRTPEPSMLNECKDCVVDAIAQIQDRFNYEQSRRGEK